MSEDFQPIPEGAEDFKAEENKLTVKELIEREKAKLTAFYDKIPKKKTLTEEEFRQQDGMIREFQKREVDERRRHPGQREKFKKDAISICQRAFNNGDNIIIFLDKGARGYGLLTHKLLLIVRLHFAIEKGVDPNSIKLPMVHFIDNPNAIGNSEYEQELLDSLEDSRFANELRGKMGHYIEGSRVMIVDESYNTGAGINELKKVIERLFPNVIIDELVGGFSGVYASSG